MRIFLRSKLHKAIVTEARLDYVGSVTIDEDLMDLADMLPFEKVLIVDNTNGTRLETYTIAGQRGSGCICINGAAAHLIRPGDEVIIMTFEAVEKPVTPTVVLLSNGNRAARKLEHPEEQEGKLESELYR
ncbi:MAG: aspartate 1-decarboxylase [Planctomycetes bacterium]|nr:aspartate 1-decarboxylase [Planctomycetota bacterium]